MMSAQVVSDVTYNGCRKITLSVMLPSTMVAGLTKDNNLAVTEPIPTLLAPEQIAGLITYTQSHMVPLSLSESAGPVDVFTAGRLNKIWKDTRDAVIAQLRYLSVQSSPSAIPMVTQLLSPWLHTTVLVTGEVGELDNLRLEPLLAAISASTTTEVEDDTSFPLYRDADFPALHAVALKDFPKTSPYNVVEHLANRLSISRCARWCNNDPRKHSIEEELAFYAVMSDAQRETYAAHQLWA